VSRSDRIIKKIVSWAIGAIYRKVEVRQREGLTAAGPQLANASHFGGFSDPLVLVYAMDRVPRFVARDVIWRFAPARWIMNWVGAIPVHKPEDKGKGTSNDQMFASTYTALHEGELVTIFPEGITVDTPQIASIKTGSARIALGARANGVEGLTLVSAGIHYGNKAALRSEVFVDIGWSIDLDARIDEFVPQGASDAPSDHAAVHALTQAMEANLRLAAPNFEDWSTAHSLGSAAEVALRPVESSDPKVHQGDRERLASMLETSDERAEVVEAMDRYQADLDAMGFTDAMLVRGLSKLSAFTWYVVRTLVIAFLLLPFAVIGIAVNVIPMVIVWLIGRLRVDDAMMATVKPLGALAVFAITWGVWLWVAFRRGGPESLAAMFLLLPVYLFALIAWFERVTLLVRAVRGFRKSRSVKDVYETIWLHRTAVVEAVAQAL
jgi:glycerol-3-phosphate O-acyltransferase / dihydroxyacetone phosphate acyltransferase